MRLKREMMRNQNNTLNTSAVSEVIGGLLLLVIAVLVFAVIYNVIFPLPEPDLDSNIKLKGYVNTDNQIILEHIGGEELISYCIDVRYVNNSLIETIKPIGDYEVFDISDKPYNIPTIAKLNNSCISHIIYCISIMNPFITGLLFIIYVIGCLLFIVLACSIYTYMMHHTINNNTPDHNIYIEQI